MPGENMIHITAPDGTPHRLATWKAYLDASNMSDASVLALDESEANAERFIRESKERGRAHQEAADAAFKTAKLQAEERKLAQDLSEEELRHRLLQAIEDYDDAVINVYTATQHVIRAKERMTAADTELHRFADLDAKITKFNVQQIRENVEGPLPSDLANAVQARAAVVDRIDANHKAYDALQAELKKAQQYLVDAPTVRARAVALIVSNHAKQLAERLDNFMIPVVEMRDQIASVGSMWAASANGGVSPVQLPQLALNVLRWQLQEPRVNTEYKNALRTWIKQLEVDHSAQLEERN